MNTKTAGLLIAAILLSFFGGFYLANTLNRSEIEMLRAAKNPASNSPQNETEPTLSAEEIRQKIAEADANPDDLKLQENLGMALYQYAAMKKDAKLLSEVSRLLLRVNAKAPEKRDVAVTLGNLYFDIGYFEKDNQNLQKARAIYQKILDQTPADADVRADLALTYFLENPPQYDQAAAEFQKSLETNPKHERSLQFLIQTLIKQKKTKEAETYLARLKEVNPKNTQSLAEIQAQMAREENSPQ